VTVCESEPGAQIDPPPTAVTVNVHASPVASGYSAWLAPEPEPDPEPSPELPPSGSEPLSGPPHAAATSKMTANSFMPSRAGARCEVAGNRHADSVTLVSGDHGRPRRWPVPARTSRRRRRNGCRV